MTVFLAPVVFGSQTHKTLCAPWGRLTALSALISILACLPACSGASPRDRDRDGDQKKRPNAEASSQDDSAEAEEGTQSNEEPEESSPKDKKNDPEADSKESSVDDDGSDDKDPGEEDDAEPETKFDLGAMPEPEKKNDENRPCEVDFLFVVDNSISMDKKQINLINSVPKFIKTMLGPKERPKDFHIGVVTTDAYEHSPQQCRFLGGLVSQVEMEVKKPGKPAIKELTKCGPYSTGLNYMTHEDDLYRSFACAARPGRMGSAKEKQIGALLGAIESKNGAKGRCNEGFLRSEALLVAVMITDEDAQYEQGGPQDWKNKILAAKGNDPRKVVVVSIVVPKKNQCDPGDVLAQEGEDIIKFTELFEKRGFVGDVCSPNYEPIFNKAIGVIDFACGELLDPPG